MPYLLLILEPREQRSSRTPEEAQRVYADMVRFGEQLRSQGRLKAAESLSPDQAGIRVKVRTGKRVLLDGPFSESKEMIGGFFLIDCDNREQAIEIACQCPAAQWATVEVREIAPCYEG